MRPGTRRSFDEPVCAPHEIAALLQVAAPIAGGESPLLAGTALEPSDVHDSATRVSLRQIVQACRNALEAGAGDSTAFAVGRQLDLSRFGMYGYAMLSCRTFRAATRLAIQYQGQLNPTVSVSLHEEQDEVAWRFDPAVDLDPEDGLYRFLSSIYLASVLAVWRDLAGSEVRPLRVSLRCAMPGDVATHEHELQCPVSFRRPFNEIRVAADALDRPVADLSPTAAGFVRATGERLLASKYAQGGMAASVVRLLAERPGRFDDMDTIAKKLATTTRTLRRRLIAEGTSFQYLLAWVYSQIAKEYLSATRLTTADIGEALGFNDASNFRHAFRRWTGHTTGNYRPRPAKTAAPVPTFAVAEDANAA